MARTKTTRTKSNSVVSLQATKTTQNKSQLNLFATINKMLPTVFYITWIIIGLYFLLVVYSQVRQGALKDLLVTPQTAAEETAAPQAEPQTETTLGGIGKVNIDCVQSALSPEAIQKVLTDKGNTNLTPEEKTKLAKCVVAENASPSPAASPNGQ